MVNIMSCHLIVCLHALHYTGLWYSQLILYYYGMQAIATYTNCDVSRHLIACMQTTAKCTVYLWGLIVCMHSNCRLLPFVQYCSSINIILVMYRKRSSEQTDADTSNTSEDFDKPPQKKRWSVSLIIKFYCGYHCVFGPKNCSQLIILII